jgi:eukaryotic-like serine/threonine-protein kinase
MKDPLLGRLIAQRYRLIARLGSGGMADVYLARHVMIERLIAIKFLHKHLGDHEDSRDRFLREARAVNRLNHANIVEITDYGESEGLVYLVMEYVPGEPLTRHLERGPLGWRRAAGIGFQVASALGRAHQMGVIHRDLKPSNVLLVARRDGGDLVKLTDFGVAKMMDAPTITTSSVALGTPGYVAPEYSEYGSVDARSDLFSLGVVLYEATAGTLPFPSAPRPGVLPLAPEPLASFAPDVPDFFDEVVRTLLARDPDDRPRDGFEAHDLLRRVLERAGQRAAPPAPESSPGARAIPPAAPSDPASQPARARRSGPHLTTAPFDRIAPTCVAALERLEAAAPAGASASTRAALQVAHKHVAMVEAIARMVALDDEAIEAAVARGRTVRADLGAKLDAVAREHSKTLGWAGTIAERTDLLRSRRDSGEHPIPAVDAFVWEQAALEQEEDHVRRQGDELKTRMTSIQAEIARQNERLEHDMLVATARLEGHIAALRSMALEAWLGLGEVARRLDVALDPEKAASGQGS